MTSLILGEHRLYLADPRRLDLYRRAVRAVVRPGDVVVDLGSGTGVLGVFACEAGAVRVHAVDASSMLGVAKGVARDNGVADRFTFHATHSLRTVLPEPADVVIGDQLGPSGVEAGVFECYADARARFLRPGGHTIPGRVDLLVAPVTAPEVWGEVDFWASVPGGVDVSSIGPLARNSKMYAESRADDLLAPAATLASFDPTDPAAATVRATVQVDVAEAGTLHGIAAWFDAELAPGIRLTNSPVDPGRIDRLHAIYPVQAPVPVRPGHQVEVAMHLAPAEGFVRWVVKVREASGDQIAASYHSTLEGMPLSKEVLDRGRPDARPLPTVNGAVRRTVLQLCDGDHTVADIEAAVLARHPEVVASHQAAAGLVAQILTDDTA